MNIFNIDENDTYKQVNLNFHSIDNNKCFIGFLNKETPAGQIYEKLGVPTNKFNFYKINEEPTQEYKNIIFNGSNISFIEVDNICYINETIKMMYVMGENPIVSDPDINHVKEAFGKLDFLVVQDLFITETAEFADVILPAASFAEKDGTFTNTERRVQRVRKAIDPVGNTKSDGLIIQELMQYFDPEYKIKNASELMDEIAELTPIYHGIDYQRIEQLGLQWPVFDKEHAGTKFLYEGGFEKLGKGKFTPVHYKGAAELPDDTYPLTLTTGRTLYHYHTITLTGKNEEIMEIIPTNFIEVNPITAKKYKLKELESVIVSSRRGETKAEVHITEKIGEDTIFMPFHFADGANMLTNTVLDETCNIPELKVCAVEISKQ